jgi:hypothetical protein
MSQGNIILWDHCYIFSPSLTKILFWHAWLSEKFLQPNKKIGNLSLLSRKQQIRHVMSPRTPTKQMRMMAQMGRSGETSAGFRHLLPLPRDPSWKLCGLKMGMNLVVRAYQLNTSWFWCPPRCGSPSSTRLLLSFQHASKYWGFCYSKS